MILCPSLLPILFEILLFICSEATWHLGMNINPCDGHNFGYGGPWADNSDVGSAETQLTADSLNNTVWSMHVGYVTIARHDGAVCEMSKTWKLLSGCKSMFDYLSDYPGRMHVTGDGGYEDDHIHSDISDDFQYATDPIFGANGGLVFNWYYSNNGARIAVTGGYKTPGTLPGISENNDDLHGLGNEFGANTASGAGSGEWWHDVGQLSGDCHGDSCFVVGTDRGTSLSDGPCWGSYAIFVSDVDIEFECTGNSMAVLTTSSITAEGWTDENAHCTPSPTISSATPMAILGYRLITLIVLVHFI